jgi:hypothetical protein
VIPERRTAISIRRMRESWLRRNTALCSALALLLSFGCGARSGFLLDGENAVGGGSLPLTACRLGDPATAIADNLPQGGDFRYSNGAIYWWAFHDGTLHRVPTDGSGATTFAQSPPNSDTYGLGLVTDASGFWWEGLYGDPTNAWVAHVGPEGGTATAVASELQDPVLAGSDSRGAIILTAHDSGGFDAWRVTTAGALEPLNATPIAGGWRPPYVETDGTSIVWSDDEGVHRWTIGQQSPVLLGPPSVSGIALAGGVAFWQDQRFRILRSTDTGPALITTLHVGTMYAVKDGQVYFADDDGQSLRRVPADGSASPTTVFTQTLDPAPDPIFPDAKKLHRGTMFAAAFDESCVYVACDFGNKSAIVRAPR